MTSLYRSPSQLASNQKKMRALEQGRAFRTAAKGLVSIGAGLAQLKEFRSVLGESNVTTSYDFLSLQSVSYYSLDYFRLLPIASYCS